MRVETVAGQYLDVLGENDPAQLVGRPGAAGGPLQDRQLHRPAAAALRRLPWPGRHADDPLVAAYTRYGLAVGEAFQLRDDLLGVYGDPAATGKPAGDDLRTGKPTALLMLARQLATPAQLQRRLERAGRTGAGRRPAGRAGRARPARSTRVERMIAERVSRRAGRARRRPDRPDGADRADRAGHRRYHRRA